MMPKGMRRGAKNASCSFEAPRSMIFNCVAESTAAKPIRAVNNTTNNSLTGDRKNNCSKGDRGTDPLRYTRPETDRETDTDARETHEERLSLSHYHTRFLSICKPICLVN